MTGWQWLGVTMVTVFFVAFVAWSVHEVGWVQAGVVWLLIVGLIAFVVLAALLISGAFP